MRYRTFLQTLAFSLLAFPTVLQAQGAAQGQGIYGLANDQLAFCATVLPNGRTRIAGLTRTALPASSPSNGYLIDEAAAPFGDLLSSSAYNQGLESFTIKSVDAHPTNGNMAAVAISKPGTQTHNDAVFMDINSVMNVTHARIWNSTNNETPNKVKVLSDGSYVVLGKFVTPVDGNSQSFVTRLAAAPSYAPIFHRVIGRTSTALTLDEAIAVEQLPDGRLVVMGQTFHFSRTSQGSIYLAVITLTGTIDEFHVYQAEASVRTPRPKDMARMADGSLIIVGRTTDASGNGALNGFLMKVAPDRQSATMLEMVQPSGASFNEELNAIVHIPATDHVAVVGNVSVVTQSFTSLDALLLTFDNSMNLLTNFRTGGAVTNEFYMDVVLRENGTVVEAVGVTDLVPSGSGANGQNILHGRYALPTAGICAGGSVALNLVPKAVSHITPVVQSTTTMSVVTGSIARIPLTTGEFFSCSTGKADIVVDMEAPLETALFPNPATGSTTLRIGDLEGVARLRLLDISGRIARQWETSEAESEIDLQGLARGLYMLDIVTSAGRETKKLVVE